MNTRTQDGSAGDVDYGATGSGYSSYRRPDTRIARFIAEALDGAHTVLNVGAGTGSYESAARTVTAVEPSESMRAQRPARHPGPGTRASATCARSRRTKGRSSSCGRPRERRRKEGPPRGPRHPVREVIPEEGTA